MPIRHYTTDELLSPACSHISLECEEMSRSAQQAGELNTMLYAGDAGTFVAFDDDGRAIGYLSLSAYPDDHILHLWQDGSTMYVEQVLVSPTARGQHVMSSLYGQLFASGMATRVICSIANSNAPSIEAHTSLGFSPVGSHGQYTVFVLDI